MLSPVMNPGGSWNGDYLIAELAHFEAGSHRKTARVFQTKTVSWDAKSRPTFPLYEAEELARKIGLAEGCIERASLTGQKAPSIAADEEDPEAKAEDEEDEEFNFDELDFFGSEAEEEPKEEPKEDTEELERQALEYLEALDKKSKKAKKPDIELDAKEYLPHFRLGGWLRRLPTIPEAEQKIPNTGSGHPRNYMEWMRTRSSRKRIKMQTTRRCW